VLNTPHIPKVVKKLPTNKDKVVSAFQKMMADKAAVCAYLRGQISRQELEAKGITLAKPI